MANDLNKWQGIGRLGKDPEVRSFPNGDSVCNFSIATGETWKDKTTGEKKERTEWHNIVATKALADICGKYLKKGSRIYACGSLRTRKWEKDGVTHYSTEVQLQDMQMLDAKLDGGAAKAAATPAPKQSDAGASDGFSDDDIPF